MNSPPENRIALIVRSPPENRKITTIGRKLLDDSYRKLQGFVSSNKILLKLATEISTKNDKKNYWALIDVSGNSLEIPP